ncbi:hypothetical protein AXG93_2931s1660 [Marchantia polymorpha subsp. ruderalis]|uniref:Integrase catalytic domain-containing protein n=1 Tax=Marchantia polymorpha subsp. ruderalis TaxID=1480154 RepID=A0A176VXC5_MARPO|nr:hypothetical protein AXG93_2931s1660 [Marchantia polymorpha subsp. ruderalis]
MVWSSVHLSSIKSASIKELLGITHTPQQNGVAEWMNQTLLEKARCMLSNVGLARRFWAEAVTTACYQFNRSPYTGIDCKTPHEENQAPMLVENQLPQPVFDEQDTGQFETVIPGTGSDEVVHQTVALDRPRRIKVTPLARYRFDDLVGYALLVAEEMDDNELSTYKAAISGSESAQWLAAMEEEMESLHENQIWELVRLPAISTIGYNRSPYDCCVYYIEVQGGSFVYLVLYVDDMLISAKSKSDIQKLKALLSAEFEMKDLGVALETEEEKKYMSRIPYASAVGSLMYAMIYTRPDLAFAVCVVSQYMVNSRKEHWQAVKRIFTYLRGTSDIGLCYGNDTQCLVVGYSDFDYAGDVDSMSSMTGYVFTLRGSVVSWKLTLQPTVTLSTTEAEYMALTEAAKEGIWLKGLVNDLGLHQDQALLYCDSLSAICLTKYQVHHEKTKHIKSGTIF